MCDAIRMHKLKIIASTSHQNPDRITYAHVVQKKNEHQRPVREANCTADGCLNFLLSIEGWRDAKEFPCFMGHKSPRNATLSVRCSKRLPAIVEMVVTRPKGQSRKSDGPRLVPAAWDEVRTRELCLDLLFVTHSFPLNRPCIHFQSLWSDCSSSCHFCSCSPSCRYIILSRSPSRTKLRASRMVGCRKRG